MIKPESKQEYTFSARVLTIIIFKNAEEQDSVSKLFDNDRFLTAISYYNHHKDLSLLTDFLISLQDWKAPKKVSYSHEDEEDFVTLIY